MILFTAGAAALVYANFGTGALPLDYGAALLALGFTVTLAGQASSLALVRALRRRSVIVFAMAALMVLATCAGMVSAAAALSAVRGGGGWWGWGALCPAAQG